MAEQIDLITPAKQFAFYGRVSTEDQQDPASSRQWQLARSRSLIEPHGGEIVAEYFDIGLSRSLPWQRRPEATRLLADLRRADRGFDAVVVGEPARAFYGGQFGLTFPIFVHFDVELWVPEVGGAVDPGSDAHDLVMSLYGGMSKGERNRIKIRVRTAMATQAATEGRFLGGRPPYGYRLADAGPHPNPGKAANGQRLHRLELDPTAAPVVARIFADFIDGEGLGAIADGLTLEGILCPSAADPARNANRQRNGGTWAKSAVRAILSNPRYTGRQVWNRQRRHEILVDVDDVALGHETKLRWNRPDDWIWSQELAQEPIIDTATWEAAQHRFAVQGRSVQRLRRETTRTYLLRRLLRCGICGRRMIGDWKHGKAGYRCRYPGASQATVRQGHPRSVHVREDLIVEALDDWLARLFDPEHRDATVDALLATSDATDPRRQHTIDVATQDIAACDRRLGQYRAALDQGTDPATVTAWITETANEHAAAQARLDTARRQHCEPTRADIEVLIERLAQPAIAIANAEPAKKAKLYSSLRLKLTLDPANMLVTAEAGLDQAGG